MTDSIANHNEIYYSKNIYNFRIKVVRFLCTGESQPMGVLHLPMMLICSKVPVANHLLHSLKVWPPSFYFSLNYTYVYVC